jgi:hypothetical protein
VLESSLDSVNWTEIDRRADSADFKRDWERASFAVSRPSEGRFIRLTQTGRRLYYGAGYLDIQAFEFFGTLLE